MGELKSIEEGLIVDLCSVYDNKVSLKVGGKQVASGELVIINDRFGVRIQNVTGSSVDSDNTIQQTVDDDVKTEEDAKEDFDYSDFEVEEKEG